MTFWSGVLPPLTLAWDETESLSRTESRMSKIVRVTQKIFHSKIVHTSGAAVAS